MNDLVKFEVTLFLWCCVILGLTWGVLFGSWVNSFWEWVHKRSYLFESILFLTLLSSPLLGAFLYVRQDLPHYAGITDFASEVIFLSVFPWAAAVITHLLIFLVRVRLGRSELP